MTAKLLLALLALLCFALLNMVTPIAATESTSLPMTDETAQIEAIIAASTEQQRLEREFRAKTKEEARQRRNANPQKSKTMPKPGDLNSMLAWAIENSDPATLKELRHKAEAKESAGEALGPAEAQLIGADSEAMQQHAQRMADEERKRDESVMERKAKYEAKIGNATETLDALFKPASEQMKKPIEVLQNATNPNRTTVPDWEGVRAALDRLEEHVEDIDKANDVGVLGGVRPLLDLITSPEEGLPARSATVLGQMASNNIKAQRLLTQEGAVPALLEAIQASPEPAAQSKLLYALGAILRNHPEAQDVAFGKGAASAVYALIRSGHPKLQKRAATLTGDLAAQHLGWGLWLGAEVRGSQGGALMALLAPPERPELHETALHILVGVLTRPTEGQAALVADAEADTLLEVVRPAVKAYLERSEAAGDEGDGYVGPKLARALLAGRAGLAERLAAQAAKEEL